jgi:hypothetical protein
LLFKQIVPFRKPYQNSAPRRPLLARAVPHKQLVTGVQAPSAYA